MKGLLIGIGLMLYFNCLYAQNWKGDFKTADSLYNKGEYHAAIKIYEESLPQAERELGKESKSYASKINSVALCYMALGIYGKSEALFIQSMGIKEALLGKVSSEYAVSCNNLGELYKKQGLYSKSEALFLESKQIKLKVLGNEHPSYAITCNNLANIYALQGKYDLAESIFLEAKGIQEKLNGKENKDYASTCSNLADLYKKQGLYTQAEKLCKEAMEIRERLLGKEHPLYAISCNNLASIMENQGNYPQAEVYYILAKDIRERMLGNKHPSYANSCINLANLYAEQSLFSKAELLYLEAKSIIEDKQGKTHSDYANLCGNLAELYRKQGLYAKSELLNIEAKNVRESVFGKNHPDYATSCNSLALIYEKRGMYSKAIPLYLEAKKIRESILGKDHPHYAMSCNNLAMLYKDQGKYELAEPLFKESMEIKERTLGKSHPSYAVTCNNLAKLYQKQGLLDKSVPLFHSAISIVENAFGKIHPSYAIYCNNLAQTYESQHNWELAESYYKEGLKPYIFQIENNFSTLSEKEKGLFYKSFAYNFEIFYSFASKRYMENPSISMEVYNHVLSTKALLFGAGDKMRNRILRSKDTMLISLYERLKSKKSNLVKAYESSVQERKKQGIDIKALELEANEIEKQLSQKSELFATLNDKKKYTWSEVQTKLKPGEVAVEIVRYRVFDGKWTDTVRYMALIVTPKCKYPEMVVLKNGKDLEGKYMKYYQNAIKSKVQDINTFQHYWAPIDAILGSATKVYLSYDGVYNLLSMNTLFDVGQQKYVSDKYEVEVLTNTKDLCFRNQEASPKLRNGVLVGFPDYNQKVMGPGTTEFDTLNLNEENERFFNGETISELPATKTEVENLEKILSSKNVTVQKMVGKNATETNLKSIQYPGILHIATHGFFLADLDKNNPDEKSLNIDTKTLKSNPLLRSGLLFSNAQSAIRNGGDGVLTAYEAMNLDLDNTELVVMSACETGLGEIRNGEGVFGLQRAFQTAGAKTVLMSLWTVSDEATQKLMTLFYENLVSKNQTKRTAFKNAQYSLRKIYPEPYYWGAFVMVGE